MEQKISLIAAMDEDRVIGIDSKLPWHLPADLENFHRITKGKSFIMGKKSYLSPDKLLSSKRNLILAHTPNFKLCPNCEMVTSIEDAMRTLKDEKEIFILGGAHVFSQTIHMADSMYLTIIHSRFEGDACFPEYNKKEWEVIKSNFHQKDEENPNDYTFLELRKK